MLRRTLLKISKNWNCMFVRRSALFMNGPKATENFVYLVPYVDFPERIKRKDIIQEQLIKRKNNINLNKIDELWSVYKDLEQRKFDYDKKKAEISKELVELMKSDPEGENTNKLKLKISLLKDDLKKLKSPLWSAEEAAIIEALKLPNVLHPQTPDTNKIIHTCLSQPNSNKNHLTIGKELDLIEFKKNENYYLKGDAAIFELGAKFYFSNILKNNKFHQFSNPDFVKSMIIEGCGLDHTNPDFSFILHHNEDSKVNTDSRLHLTGGGSLCSFLAYYAKNVLYERALPLRLFSMGRQYIPSPTDEDSLFHVSQSSVLQLFGMTKNSDDLDCMLNELINLLKIIYGKFGYHYRICFVAADKLSMWESLRLSVEMFSASLNSYVEVGNISVSGDFISKRLMLTYVENKESRFPHILSGTILNVPKFLACILEQNEEFCVPHEFRVVNWTI